MREIKNLEIFFEDNSGCNNGNYPEWTAETLSGKKIGGITCRCGRGCSNTDAIISIQGKDYLLEEQDSPCGGRDN
jgi:hypothetical protein